jgi:hypothetical protein
MSNWSENTKEIPINIVGSSVFGRYPKISTEKTLNMFQSETFMVPYAGYQIAINSNQFQNAKEGRGIFNSVKLEKLILVVDSFVYLVSIKYDQTNEHVEYFSKSLIGTLETTSGIVYIAENNKPQICISDGLKLYIYDQTQSPSFTTPSINFTPGYITFHDTRFIAAALGTNSWRLSLNNNGSDSGGVGTGWPTTASFVGLIESKPDNIQAVVRFPSKGNMIFVMGSTVTEAWVDVGAQLFPYQRITQYNIDYGCLSAASVAYMDQYVCWLAQNEKSGPIIMYSDGGIPEKITTDGIDYLFSQMQNPENCQAFFYRQDGHLFYHINFYTDNLSLYYDFNTNKFYNASDHNFNYFIASEVAFFNNQYYFVTKNNGCLFAFDTIFTTYQDLDKASPPNVVINEIPRLRICKNIRHANQGYFIVNDIGFTIESGETNSQQQITGSIGLTTQDGNTLVTQSGNALIYQQLGFYLTTPGVDLSLSYDGGASFGNQWRYDLPSIGQRRNRLIWWQCGISNDIVPQFFFWGLGRFVITDGVCHVRE